MKPAPAFLTGFLAACFGTTLPAQADCKSQIVTGAVKIRPYGALPEISSAPPVCARNSYCSFQVVTTADGENCRVTDVSVSGFRSITGTIPDSNVMVYRQGFINVFSRSSEEGAIGEWPDPLIPKVDAEYGEARNAFPVDINLISAAYRRYPLRPGHTIRSARGAAWAISSGRYTGSLEKQFIIQIERPGRIGEATFRWYSQPGPVQRSNPILTSTSPIALEDGVLVSFTHPPDIASNRQDFLAQEEFWIFAGPLRRQPVWVDVWIPADAAPGLFSATVSISKDSSPVEQLSIPIEVVPFEMPSTMPLANFFGMYWRGLWAGHRLGPMDESRFRELGQAYSHAALRNAITVEGGEDFIPEYKFNPDGSLAPADYSKFDQAVGSFLDGTAMPNRARWTSLKLPALSKIPREQFILIVQDFARHARERGWADRLFDYTSDEPHGEAQFDALYRRVEMLRKASPEIPRLVTTNLRPDLIGTVTRWCANITDLDPKNLTPMEWWSQRGAPHRPAYGSRLTAGDSLWIYHSCESHNCNGTGRAPGSNQWPNYLIDAPALNNRVFGFLASVTYRTSGILYWNVNYAFAQDTPWGEEPFDAWESQYYFGGNGDGTLFYPGHTEIIGGTHPVPVESLRLKFVRDSMYDAAMAKALQAQGDDDFLRAELATVVERAWRWDASPLAWQALQERLLKRLRNPKASVGN